MMPEVRHYKIAGGSYRSNSPLYAKQQGRGAPAAAGPAAASAAPAAEPPVFTTMKCVLGLTAQFFAVHTVNFVVQTLSRLQLVAWERKRHAEQLRDTVHFVPMLCILFVAARLRAVQLTQGATELYELPQWWVKM